MTAKCSKRIVASVPSYKGEFQVNASFSLPKKIGFLTVPKAMSISSTPKASKINFRKYSLVRVVTKANAKKVKATPSYT